MNNHKLLLANVLSALLLFTSLTSVRVAAQDTKSADVPRGGGVAIRKAPAPLYRDPIFDGAADPAIVWNRGERSWWMLYTQRRANVDAADVAFCHGTAIGVASSADHGRSWVYRGTLDLEFERGQNTFWAPDIVYDNGAYHMFVACVSGVRNHWGGKARMAHYTSRDMWEWGFKSMVKLSSDNVIDATLYRTPAGAWRMWYKDDTRGSITMLAESNDLESWKLAAQPAIGGGAHEGPKVFRFGAWYWMLTDEWAGMRVYRSRDLETWEKQGKILDTASRRPEDGPSGAHGDVVVTGDKAYIFYFTHPERKQHLEAAHNSNGVIPYALRRSSVQVAELKIKEGTLACERDFDFYLPDL